MIGYLWRLIFGTFKSCSHEKWLFLGKLEGSQHNAQQCVNCGFVSVIKEPSADGCSCNNGGEHSWYHQKSFVLARGGKDYATNAIYQCIYCRNVKYVKMLYAGPE